MLKPKTKKGRRRVDDTAVGIALRARQTKQPPSMVKVAPKVKRYVQRVERLDDFALDLANLKDRNGADIFDNSVRPFLGAGDLANLVKTRNIELDRALAITGSLDKSAAFSTLNGINYAKAGLQLRKDNNVRRVEDLWLTDRNHRSTVSSLLGGQSSYDERKTAKPAVILRQYLAGSSYDQYQDLVYKLGSAGMYDLFNEAYEYEHDYRKTSTVGDVDDLIIALAQAKAAE